MRPHRLTFLLRTTAVGLLAVSSLGGLASCSDAGTHRDSALRQSKSNLNTASQKTFENSATFVDVPDDPVSLPRAQVIYPPTTGNAGSVARHAAVFEALALLSIAVVLITATRFVTPAPASGRSSSS